MINISEFSKVRPPENIRERVGGIILFAIETTIRASEVCKLEWKHEYLHARYVKVLEAKNGQPRKVALSPKAIELLVQFHSLKLDFNGKVFGVNNQQLDALFREIRDKAKIENMHFHDTRHEAITRMARTLDLPALLRVVGLKDPKILLMHYNKTIEDIALGLAK